MRLLALDQASQVSGAAIFEDGKLIESLKLSYNDEELATRLVKIRAAVQDLIKDYEIDQVAIEDIQLQQGLHGNVVTYRTLAEVRGVLEELFKELNIPYQIVPSVTWKSALGLKGAKSADQKRAAQEYVINKYNFKPIQDICDAICIGEYICNQNQGQDWAE